MQAIKGYFDGEKIIPLEKVRNIKENQKVIITVLDEYIDVEETEGIQYPKNIGVLEFGSFRDIEEALKEVERIEEN